MRSAAFTVIVFFVAVAFPSFALAAEPAILIDFETHGRGEIVAEQYAVEGIVFRASNWSDGPDAAVMFDTTNIGASEDNDLAAPFSPATGFEQHGDLEPGNVLVLHERNDCTATHCAEPDDEASRPAGWIELHFAVPSTLHGMNVIDLAYEAGETPATLVMFDAANSIIATLDVPTTGGSGNWLPWSIEQAGVSRARLHIPGDAAIDDIAFTPGEAINWTPVIRSVAPVAVAPDATWTYTPDITDADNDVTSLQILTGPAGMVLSPGGTLSWTPGGATGEFPVEIEVNDNRGGVARQAFVVHAADAFVRVQNFEFATGTIVDNELLTDGVAIRAFNASKGPHAAVTFDTDAPTSGDDDLAAPFDPGSSNNLGLGQRSPGHVLILHENHDCDVLDQSCTEPDNESSNPAGWIEFEFAQPAHVWSIDVFDVTSDDPAARTVELFDANGQLLSTGLVVPRTGTNDWDRLMIDATGVMRMRVNVDGETGLDDLRYALVGSAEPDNQPPVINDDEYSIERDKPLTVAAPGILANDHDPDGGPITAVLDDAPNHGTLQLNADGSFVYTPNAGFTGIDEFEYTASDGEAASLPDDVEIHVNAPTSSAIIQSFTVTPGTISTGQSATLSWTVEQASSVSISPGVGTVSIAGSIAVSPSQTTTYTLTATGTDNITITAGAVLTVEAPPSVGPTIAFDYPADGQPVHFPRPPLGMQILDYDAGVTLQNRDLRIDGMPLAADCSLRVNDRIVCTPDAPISEGTHTISMQIFDIEGDISNLAQVTYYTDLTPPDSPDATKLAITAPNTQGRSTVTGEAGAVDQGDTVRLRTPYNNDVQSPGVNSDGSFFGLIRQEVGGTVYVHAVDIAGNESVPVELIVPSPAPVIEITSPADGFFTNNNQPEIIISYLQAGAGIDHATLTITVDGGPLVVTCTHSASSSQCTPSAPLAEGQHNLTASVNDANGAQSNAASVTFTIDSTPPQAVVREKVTLVQEPEGTVTITGTSGAAEPGTTVTITIGAQTVNAVVDSVGMFTSAIGGNTGDSVSVTVTDSAGNTSAMEIFVVNAVPMTISILSPVDGDALAGTVVAVTGQHTGAYGTGVTVNGYPAAVAQNGSFFLTQLVLEEGANSVVATATSPDGEVASTTISVTAQSAPPSRLQLTAESSQGPSPQDTNFQLAFDGDIDSIQLIELDYDGDGNTDHVSINPFEDFSYTFANPGIYHPAATVTTSAETFTAGTAVVVEDLVQLDAFLRGRLGALVDGLATGDKQRALAVMSPGARKRFETLFDAIMPVIQANLSSWQAPQAIRISGNLAEYLILRNRDGKQYGYLVIFQRMPDGTWKLTTL